VGTGGSKRTRLTRCTCCIGLHTGMQNGTRICCHTGPLPIELVEHWRNDTDPVDYLLPLVCADLVHVASRDRPFQGTAMQVNTHSPRVETTARVLAQ
jgi:hypothetical protein